MRSRGRSVEGSSRIVRAGASAWLAGDITEVLPWYENGPASAQTGERVLHPGACAFRRAEASPPRRAPGHSRALQRDMLVG